MHFPKATTFPYSLFAACLTLELNKINKIKIPGKEFIKVPSVKIRKALKITALLLSYLFWHQEMMPDDT